MVYAPLKEAKNRPFLTTPLKVEMRPFRLDPNVYTIAANGYIRAMSTAELIYEKAKALPEPLQTEALHYVDYLLARRENGDDEAAEWARFSAQQLSRAYSPSDAIYDED